MHENIQSYSNLITLKNKDILTDELWYLSWQLLRFAFLWEPGCLIGMMRVFGLGRQRATLGSVLPNATSIFRRQQWLFLLFFLSVVNSCPCLTHGEFNSLLSQNCFCLKNVSIDCGKTKSKWQKRERCLQRTAMDTENCSCMYKWLSKVLMPGSVQIGDDLWTQSSSLEFEWASIS